MDMHEHTHLHKHDDATHAHEHNHSHTHANTKKVLDRMSRAIGHLNAVRSMIEDGRDCSAVLIQLSAVRAAINGISKVILKDHLDHCIIDAVKTGDMATLEELNHAIEMLLK